MTVRTGKEHILPGSELGLPPEVRQTKQRFLSIASGMSKHHLTGSSCWGWVKSACDIVEFTAWRECLHHLNQGGEKRFLLLTEVQQEAHLSPLRTNGWLTTN